MLFKNIQLLTVVAVAIAASVSFLSTDSFAQSAPPSDTGLPPEPAEPIPEPPAPLPSPEDLLPLPPTPPDLPEPGLDVPGTVVVERFEVIGSTVFSEAELAAATQDYVNRPITFTELFEARSAVTQLYLDAGYVSSGAFLPSDQFIDDGVVEIRVVEGSLEDINIEGLKRLHPGYIRSRIGIAAQPPLNVEDLVESLQLLQINPLIESISAELAAGTRTGGSILNLTVKEAPAIGTQITLDNSRSTTVGSFRRRATFSHANVLGLGDGFNLSYSNTDGSDTWEADYTIPINPRNGTVGVSFSTTDSRVVADDFEVLGIRSDSDQLSFNLRQPIIETPTELLALGLSFDHDRTSSTFQLPGAERLPFETLGSEDGETRLSAVRFSQEWTQRSADEVLALRSQFSLGVPWFDATTNDGGIPDSEFFSWQGQAQWVKLFGRDQLLVARLNGQLADGPLLSLEQFRLGGQGSVRGYRQDQSTADNGLFASVEMRFPLLSIPDWDTTAQIAPFIDYGWGWNNGDRADPDPDQLLSVGTGLLWQIGDRVTARIDFGIPLIDPGPEGDSLQESGILFTLSGELF
ncbi:MAG: ShlB/FhaC/HecB family hemolysin secretion/activation protein [Cyanobacteria bacterium P01_D01_bin.156]